MNFNDTNRRCISDSLVGRGLRSPPRKRPDLRGGERSPRPTRCSQRDRAKLKGRWYFLVSAFAGLIATPAALLAQATIDGVIALPASRTAPVVNQRYTIVSSGGVIATNPPVAVVYLAGDFPKPATPPVRQMIQRGLDFEPRLLPVQVGTRIEFPNLDDTYHNVFSYSPPKRFDLGRYRKGEEPVPAQVFDTPGLVTLRCDIHEHMRAVILVLETPHFVITDGAGRFQLTGLPAGRYTLKVWMDSKTTLEHAVELTDGATLHVNLP